MTSITLDWLQIIILLGAFQGVVLAFALAAKRRNRTANRLLAVLVAAFSLFLASTVYYSAGLVRVYPHLFGVSYQTPWIFGPLVYLYAVAASDRTWRFRARDTLHFLPVTITILATLPVYLMSGPEKLAVYERAVRGELPGILPDIDPFKYVSGIAYSVATVLYLRRHRHRVEESYSNTERVNLAWLLWLSGAAAAIWALAVWLRLSGAAAAVRDEHISLAIALLIYAIGYLGLRQPEIFRYETAEYPIPLKADVGADVTTDVTADVKAESPRYQRSGLTDRQAERLKDALMALMDRERPWQDSELTLADLAARLSTTPHKLSEVLNSQLGKTFYDFVNGYRVREVQRRIAAGEAQRVKMLTLALDAGFASKSTFNLVFKKHTTQTPSDYRQAAGA